MHRDMKIVYRILGDLNDVDLGRWKENITIYFEKMGCDVEWIHLAQHRVH
jgi:hypothetical protein